jgi:hypothetical protein
MIKQVASVTESVNLLKRARARECGLKTICSFLITQGKYTVCSWIEVFGECAEITDQLQGALSFLRRHQSLSYSRISRHFMECEGSLLCSQEPTTVRYHPSMPNIHINSV